ncbi:oxygen-insensitive NADPH nitroreductase [Falsibacillus albus]|uniref:Oxygen-insensitive NADPH nitroreductase n=1 Tax=Falsibacillus albus TaxID=2478915 RepID=A0A3L7K323_9BACI|nr:oxygen-insensitive NADPH nitroreductase [Falsibacillus albus]RLQ97507.1 oxygen-insensitive NADPH nitroreductase [Falsibacillus albus]
MNTTIETLLAHHSVRKFKDQPLTREQVETIIKSAQAASTSSYIQAYTIIGVTDPVKKEKLAELAGNQSYVVHNGHFLVFCADLHRHELLAEKHQADIADSIESTEKFMVSLIDAALAAQNAAVAAESMGLGICYIGGIRNDLNGVQELLNTPSRVIPLFGMAIGYPDQDTDVKPRLPLEHIYHENTYEQDEEKYMKQMTDYDEVISKYYHKRTGGLRTDTWTGQMAKMLSAKRRMYMKDFVQGKGFDLK